MKAYFVRHGKTAYNGTGRMTGQTDLPLTEEGVEQAERTARSLPSGIEVIYSSDLLRCKQTTDILNRKLGLPIIYDPRLRERDFGSLTKKVWEEIDPDGSLRRKDENQEYNYQTFGGEAVADVKSRVFACIKDIKQQQEGKIVLIVTSAGVIRLLHHFLNNEIQQIIHNASVHEFEF